MPSVFTLIFCISSQHLLFNVTAFFLFFSLVMLTVFSCIKVFKSQQDSASVLEVVPLHQ